MLDTIEEPPIADKYTTARLSYMDAIVLAQKEEMLRDESVVLIGEDISIYGGTELVKSFDENRVRNMPISENSFTGMGIGAAMTGLRPIVDLTIASFTYLASDQIINQASKLRYMTGGQIQVPIVFRTGMYYKIGNAAQHSDRPYPFFMSAPGLKIIVPSTPADMKGLLKSAVRDDDPVMIFEDCNLWAKKQQVSTDPDYLIPVGRADIKRAGSDVTIISIGACLPMVLAASDTLQKQGISAEVVDPRTLVPLDRETLIQSVAKTGRLVIVDNAHRTNSAASEIAAVIAEEAFESLRKPIQRVTTPDVHIPFSSVLEKTVYPTVADVIEAVNKIQ
jgi:pyruvate dehydrogenase E1 component beta subunit